MALVSEELVVVMVHLLPLLVEHLLTHSRRFHSGPTLLNLKVDSLVVLGHYFVQFLVPGLSQESASRVGTLTFFKVFLFFVVYLVRKSYLRFVLLLVSLLKAHDVGLKRSPRLINKVSGM